MNKVTTNKTAWITGVNQGIGAEIMQQLIAAGIQVVGFDINNDQVPRHCQPFVHLCDIRDAAQVQRYCEQLLVDKSPDYFINVAAVLYMQAHETLSIEDWQETFAVNIDAPFYFLRTLTPYFKQRHSGSMVFIASNAGRVPRINMAAYGASKAALTHFAKTVGLELAPYGIRVNTVSPGSTLTAMQYRLWNDANGAQNTIDGNSAQYKLGIPLKKIATVQDIAHAVMFLIGDQASHITMQDLVVDGGATLGA